MSAREQETVDDREFEEMEILVDGAYGIYTPQIFARRYGGAWDVAPTDMAVLLAGPDHEHYWETWDDVWLNATLEHAGQTWHLHCDAGDIFMVVHRDD